MINRTEAPALTSIEKLEIIKPKLFDITPNVKLLWNNITNSDTIRLDLYFKGGIAAGENSIPNLVHSLLLSGTNQFTSAEIHAKIDALGGYIDSDISFENVVVSIYCLKEHLNALSHILYDAIQNCAMRQEEIEDCVRNTRQTFLENQQKVRHLAQINFRNTLFQGQEKYAQLAKIEDFDTVQQRDLLRFLNEQYKHGLFRITLVGAIEVDEVDALIDLFGSWSIDHEQEFPLVGFENKPVIKHISKEDALQTAIRLGRFWVHKQHPDYFDLTVLNTILGEYFGSRLMSNIREDKGYTYGIGSALIDLKNTSYFVVVTEVGSEVVKETLTEIQYEFQRLQNELIEEDELQLVKNYLSGQFLKSLDGPFAMLDIYNNLDLYGLKPSFIEEALIKLNKITPQRLLELAKIYLNWEDMVVITAGKSY